MLWNKFRVDILVRNNLKQKQEIFSLSTICLPGITVNGLQKKFGKNKCFR